MPEKIVQARTCIAAKTIVKRYGAVNGWAWRREKKKMNKRRKWMVVVPFRMGFVSRKRKRERMRMVSHGADGIAWYGWYE